jgi:hypothetical protein
MVVAVYPPSVFAEDFSDDEFVEEEESDEEGEEAEPTPTSTTEPTSTPTPTPEAQEESGQVLGGTSELGDTGSEWVIFVIAGIVGLVVVVAGYKVAHGNVED